MNRPEPIELENNLGPDAVTGEINRVPWMAYDVDEMDLYIAELKQKLAEKDAEIRRLKFQLWSARFEAAKVESDGTRKARCRHMSDKLKEASK